MPVEEPPYPISQNWKWVPLSALYKFIDYRGTTPHKTERGIPLVTAKNVKKGYIDYSIAEFISEEEYMKRQSRGVSHQGDILFTTEAPMGNVAIANLEKFSAGQRVITFQKYPYSDAISNQFFFYYMLSAYFQEMLDQQKTGSTVGGIKAEKLKLFPVPVPPFPEQLRIVDRIESLFAKLDEAKEKAQAVVDGFENRKAAILHKAFTGELTAEWRERNHYERNEWRTVPWHDLIDRIEAGKNWNALGRPPVEDEFGVVKVSAVTWGEFDELESKTCEQRSQWNEKVQIKTGDFLFSRANTIQLVGNCVIVKQINKRLMLSDKILRIIHNTSVEPTYVLFYTRTDLYRKQIEQLASGNQDGMRNVSQKNMGQVRIPIPCREEQKEIAQIITKLMEKSTKAKDTAEQVISQINSMKKAILARAFRGELGTNDTSEPPADISIT